MRPAPPLPLLPPHSPAPTRPTALPASERLQLLASVPDASNLPYASTALQRGALLVLALLCAASAPAAAAAAAPQAALVAGGHALSLAEQQYQQAVDIRWVAHMCTSRHVQCALGAAVQCHAGQPCAPLIFPLLNPPFSSLPHKQGLA